MSKSADSFSDSHLLYPDTRMETIIYNEETNCFVKEDKLLSVVKLFVCKVCKKKFRTKNELKLHSTEIHKQLSKKSNSLIPCEHCSQSFMNITLAIRHKLISHPDTKNYCCHDCNKVFAIKQALDLHLNSHNTNINIKSISTTVGLETPNVIHVYGCTICQKTFTETNEYEKHINMHSKKPTAKKIIRVAKLFVCEVCHQKFKKRREYEIHLKEHEKLVETVRETEVKNQVEDRIPCEHCQTISNCMSKAIQHKHRFHPQYPNYYCRVCGKLFPLKISFDNHMNTVHNYDDSPKISIALFGEYKCIVCQVEFLTEAALENHIKTAHVAMQFWANTGFIPSPSTKIVQGNTTELFSIYYCHLCGSEYVLKHNLKQHLLRDHSETERNTKPPEQIIRCVVCTARFFSLKAFETHQLNHSDTDLYVANEEERRKVVNRIDQDFDINRVPGLL